MTGRLWLEPLRVEHAEEMVSVLSDPALYEFTGGEPPSALELLRRNRAQIAGSGVDQETWRNWIVRHQESGLAIGFVQATITPATTEVAWLIGTEWQGHGYAQESAGAMAALLAADGVTSLSAWIHPEHEASHRVASSLGLAVTDEIDDAGEYCWRTVSDEARPLEPGRRCV